LEDWQKQKDTRIMSNSKLRANHNQVEEALKQSEEKNRLLFENMAEGFAYCKMSFDDENKPKDFVYL
jgi:hypothetical protein